MPKHSETDILEEEKHFAKVVEAFEQYEPYALAANNRRRKDLYTLPLDDQKLLDELGWKKKLQEIDKAIMVNANFVKQIVADTQIFSDANLDVEQDDEAGPSHSHSHGHRQSHNHGEPVSKRKGHRPTDFDMDKLRSTLKQFVRDWAEEGKLERDLCYEPMKEALLRHFESVPQSERADRRVLVPGAGLGRLAYDVAMLGFSCQGNEFSHYMLLSSFFILNRTERINQHTFYPHVHSLSNIPNEEALLRPISVPDALPSAIPKHVNFSLVAGEYKLACDFEEVYGNDEIEGCEPQAGKFDAILTCFFIDTAKNIVNYLRVIHRKLAPGGVWINLGPLLWHWENNVTNDPSIELTLEEVKNLCSKIGFKVEDERTVETTYTNNAQSMLGYVYKAAFWTATKVDANQTS